MQKSIIAAAVLIAALTMSAETSNAVEFSVGPNGLHVGPRHHHRRHFYDSCNRDRDCRIVVRHRTNRFGERVTVRKRICD
ncbi:hypothetical protein [Bradyrhizobium canariense]|uniref:hypothetical protein n=1 Tax=Bradyrhizobium canariense TaxID=255045 RepID=UPI0011777D91|nr:hypothetical protein [Bradyrhizobium canariense]